MDAIQVGTIGSPGGGNPVSNRVNATQRRLGEAQATAPLGTQSDQQVVASDQPRGAYEVDGANASSSTGLDQSIAAPTGLTGRTFETALKEALKVLRVPAPPSFQVDPANPLAILSTETSGSSLLGRDAKPLGGLAVDVSV